MIILKVASIPHTPLHLMNTLIFLTDLHIKVILHISLRIFENDPLGLIRFITFHSRLEKLQRLAERVHREAKHCEMKLDDLEKRIDEVRDENNIKRH